MPSDHAELAARERLGPRLFAGALAASALSPLGSTMIAVALPTIGRDLAAPEVALTEWLAVSYLVVSLAGQAPGGHLADRLGHVRALILGAVVNAGGAALGVIGADLPTLAAARIAMAAGGAITVPAAMALIRTRTEGGGRTGAYGAFSAAMATAAALGPPLGGEIVAVLGWRAIFAAGLPLALIAVLCLAREARSPVAREERAPFDWAGAILLAAGLGLATFAAAPGGGHGAGWWFPAAALLGLFVARAVLRPFGVVDPRLLALRSAPWTSARCPA